MIASKQLATHQNQRGFFVPEFLNAAVILDCIDHVLTNACA